MIDFQNLINQFAETQGLVFKSLMTETCITPDQLLYKINTNNGILYVYEVDFIDTLKDDVINVVKREIGEIKKMYMVKKPYIDLRESGPVIALKSIRNLKTFN